jgi:uncharacterized repeat protein (TIGR01451 family)
MTTRTNSRPGVVLAVLIAVMGLTVPASACIVDLGVSDASPSADFLFPNWSKTLVTIFDTEWCDDVTCPLDTDATIAGITIMNYGTATGGAGGDITGVYVCFDCGTVPGCVPGGPDSAVLTYAGVWDMAGTPRPIWTWAGSLPLDADPCVTCGCMYAMSVFVDIGPCPTEGRTITMGPGYDEIRDPLDPGGIWDEIPCTAPYVDTADPAPKTITYVTKVADNTIVAPGDTVTYTIFYGRPGTNPLTNVVVMDSLPASRRRTPAGIPIPGRPRGSSGR